MDLVPTDAEVAEAERIYKIAYDADFGRGYGMRRALESFLQGRAKPATECQHKVFSHFGDQKLRRCVNCGIQETAQEEITDAERLDNFQKNMELSFDYGDEDGPGFWCVHQVHGSVNDREWTLIGKGRTIREAVDAAIRASKGEKT